MMLELFLPFLIAIFLLTITPGLDTALVIRTAAIHKVKGLQAALGIACGCLAWGILVACGVGALLASSELAFNIMKWVGAIYLLWLGFGLLFKPRQVMDISVDSPAQENAFLKGLLTNILNPKVGIFYVSFLPQFVPSSEHTTMWLFGMVLVHVVLGLLWSLFLIRLMKPISKLISQPKNLRKIDQVTGSVFILFALKLAVTPR